MMIETISILEFEKYFSYYRSAGEGAAFSYIDSHWITSYQQLKKNEIYFFDTYGAAGFSLFIIHDELVDIAYFSGYEMEDEVDSLISSKEYEYYDSAITFFETIQL